MTLTTTRQYIPEIRIWIKQLLKIILSNKRLLFISIDDISLSDAPIGVSPLFVRPEVQLGSRSTSKTSPGYRPLWTTIRIFRLLLEDTSFCRVLRLNLSDEKEVNSSLYLERSFLITCILFCLIHILSCQFVYYPLI